MIDGEVSTIEVQRTQADLGVSIVGGNDTPLVGHNIITHLFLQSCYYTSFVEPYKKFRVNPR